MPRPPQDDSLEPILPKHPPVARDDVPITEPAVAVSDDPPAPRPRPSWDRLVLVGCGLVATFALVVCAIRLTSIAGDQRLQSCQVRAIAGAQDGGFNQNEYSRAVARCAGADQVDDGDAED